MAGNGAVAIHPRYRSAIYHYLIGHGMTMVGGDCVFIVAENQAYAAERFSSWVTFPFTDPHSGFFHEYFPMVNPEELDFGDLYVIPLKYWQHCDWFDGNLPVATEITLGPVSVRPADIRAGMGIVPTPPQDEVTVVAQAGVSNRPSERVEIPSWVDGLVALLEAVFPHIDPIGRHSIMQLCLPRGLEPKVTDCTSWGSVLAAVYTTAQGKHSIAVLPEVLRQVQEQYGAASALDLGMKLLGDFQVVSQIVLSNVKGEAAIVAIRKRLHRIPVADRERMLPIIMAEVCTSLGGNKLGIKQHKQNTVIDIPTKNTELVRKRWVGKKSRIPVKIHDKSGGDSQAETSEKRDVLRGGTQIKPPDRFRERGSHSVRNREDFKQDVVRSRRNIQRSSDVKVSQEEGPRSKPPFQNKQVAAVSLKDASASKDVAAKSDLGTSCGRSHCRLCLTDSESSDVCVSDID